jgi:signal transduction histidine kinase
VNRHRLTPLSAREAVALDVAVAVAVGCIGVWRELSQEPEVVRLVQLPVQYRVAVQLVGAALLLWRRQYPYAVGLATAALCLLAPTQSAPVSAYSVAAHGSDRRRVFVVIGAILVAFYLGGEVWRLADPFAAGFVIAFGAVLGLYVHARRALLAAAVERAETAEREQQWGAERAVAAERSRLAGEMHDVLSHRLSVMLLQAGALAGAISDPATRKAVDELRGNGVAALTELREVFGTFAPAESAGAGSTGPPDPPASQLGEQLADLVRQWTATGADISLRTAELPAGLSPTVGRTAFRIVQEALTNAAKHAAGAPVVVRITDAEAGIGIWVVNSGTATGVDPLVRDAGGGRGLAGLAERVALVAGRFDATPSHDGGFELTAWLPGRPLPADQIPVRPAAGRR